MNASFEESQALELLRLSTGNPTATFHSGQLEAIRHVVEGRGRLLVVQKTGWGKSIVYFIATSLLRKQGAGPTLLVSPLLALMRNQLAAAGKMGLRAETINSENSEDWLRIEAQMKANAVDLLLISPERLGSERFRNNVLGHLRAAVSLLVVDEAHCISDWGHDFRPHYRLIENLTRYMPQNLRLLGTTATANKRVMQDLQTVLGPGLTIMAGDLNRPSLTLQVLHLPSAFERMAWLLRKNGSGPVFPFALALTGNAE